MTSRLLGFVRRCFLEFAGTQCNRRRISAHMDPFSFQCHRRIPLSPSDGETKEQKKMGKVHGSHRMRFRAFHHSRSVACVAVFVVYLSLRSIEIAAVMHFSVTRTHHSIDVHSDADSRAHTHRTHIRACVHVCVCAHTLYARLENLFFFTI